MILYHMTHTYHLETILSQGFLKTTESNVSITSEHYGPDVVWALDTLWMPDGALPHGLMPEKTRVAISFDTTKLRAYRWVDWKWTAKMDPLWRIGLAHSGGGEEAAKHWWVVDHPIVSRHWLEITVDGETIWQNKKLPATVSANTNITKE